MTRQRSCVAPGANDAVHGQTTSREQVSKQDPSSLQDMQPPHRQEGQWPDSLPRRFRCQPEQPARDALLARGQPQSSALRRLQNCAGEATGRFRIAPAERKCATTATAHLFLSTTSDAASRSPHCCIQEGRGISPAVQGPRDGQLHVSHDTLIFCADLRESEQHGPPRAPAGSGGFARSRSASIRRGPATSASYSGHSCLATMGSSFFR